MGPMLIFDKSTLQSLNPDEALWLDNFFMTNITPLFFIETLADLEKEVRAGRTPEQVVGNLAIKTPDMSSRPNVHHTTLLAGELRGLGEVDMRYGRPIISGGRTVTLEGETGIIFEQSPEEEALQRWQRREFLLLERLTAKAWREALSHIDYEKMYQAFQEWFVGRRKPKTLLEVKTMADQFIDGLDQEKAFRFGLALLGVPQHSQEQVMSRWKTASKPAIKEFAPYFRHVFSIDLFFYLAIAADLISRARPSNKVDIAYLYYLPFCMVFVSSDTLHSRVVPLFVREDQTFLEGTALKADLARLDEYYSKLPDEIKNRGVFTFASIPPDDTSFLVTRLWDKYMASTWRDIKTRKFDGTDKIDPEAEKALLNKMKRFVKEAAPVDPATVVKSDDADSIMIQRKVYARKGKWKRFPPEVENSKKRIFD